MNSYSDGNMSNVRHQDLIFCASFIISDFYPNTLLSTLAKVPAGCKLETTGSLCIVKLYSYLLSYCSARCVFK